ncbi:hypothetical protein [Micavibrio aeruginosavorus]|uniref:hypothetical protein n=1 Tax=Micavibrio aeruginosavorus TaxID=349221 RepID=UPI003F4AE7A4
MTTKTQKTETTGMDFSRAAVGPDRVESAAQTDATRECQYPRQPKRQAHESFESYGLN